MLGVILAWILILVIAVVIFLAIIGVIYEIVKAPKGYENETGFHYGEEPAEE